VREVARRAVEDLLSLLRDPGQEPGDVGDGRSRNSLSLRNSFGKTTPSCSRPAWSMTRRLLWERSSAQSPSLGARAATAAAVNALRRSTNSVS
jgi:hypothetical protein